MRVSWVPWSEGDKEFYTEEFKINWGSEGAAGYFANSSYLLSKYQWNGFAIVSDADLL